MSKRLYESAGTLIFDPVASNRNATRASLHSLGFRRVETAPNLDILESHLKDFNPDLLLAEVTGVETEICDFVQSIRRHERGLNPFMVIIVTTWRRDGTVVSKVINSGADDLIARPISTAMLGERIRLQIDRRKGFVVTSDYIGPDRRRDPSRPGVKCIDVLNSLRLRTVEGLAEDEADRRIMYALEQSKSVLNSQKLRRDAVALCLHWRILEQRKTGTREFFETVARIDRIATDIRRRVPEYHDEAIHLCHAVTGLVDGLYQIRDDSSLEGTDLALDYTPALLQLGHAALGLGRLFAPGEAEKPSAGEGELLAARSRVRAA